jgi:TfoX/Sxy family transcriptional regulator of competence genes
MAYDEKLAERVRAKLKTTRGMVEKKMFGGVGFLVNGNIACGVNQQDLIVQLSDEEFAASLEQTPMRVFDMTGKPMKGWFRVSAQGTATDKALRGWIEKGVAFARSLPAK